MRSLFLEIELLDPVGFPARSATVGFTRSLDYVPGAALLGACARRLVADGADTERIWTILLSGKVRFGNALPVSSRSGCVGWPMPYSLHRPKSEPEPRAGEPLSDRVCNLAAPAGGSGSDEASEQLRSGFLAGDLEVLKPRHHSSMRTAMGGEGVAREGFLYAIDSLVPGLRFRSRIDFADEADDALDVVRTALRGDDIRLGRSRNAELGSARIVEVEPWKDPPRADIGGDSLLLYAASDLALRDPNTGAPTLRPLPETLGLDPAAGIAWDPGSSFVRVRSYSPFNGKRRRPDLERQVICAGSVLAYSLGGAAANGIDAISERLAHGVGDHRHDGLGRVLLQPVFLSERRVRAWETPAAPRAEGPRTAEEPNDELWRWLVDRDAEVLAQNAAFEIAAKWTAQLRKAPLVSSSQWGVVRRLAEESSSRDQLFAKLFARGQGALITGVAQDERRWGALYQGKKLSDYFRSLLEEHPVDDAVFLDAVRQTAGLMARSTGSEQALRGGVA